MKKYFLTGLITLLPVAVTVWIFIFLIHFLTRPFMGLVTHFLNDLPDFGIWTSEKGIQILSEITILIGLCFLTLFLGLVARRFFFDSLIKIGDNILYRIPLVNKVYKTFKEIVSSLFSSSGNSFKQVVLLPFPYKGSYCLGLISCPSPQTCSKAASHSLISVFIPTAPNPMTGFLVMVPKEDLVYLEMKPDEAFKYVVSCAVIKPTTPRPSS